MSCKVLMLESFPQALASLENLGLKKLKLLEDRSLAPLKALQELLIPNFKLLVTSFVTHAESS